ncbi:cytochrome ubiquinol oxidase subunit I [Microbacterium paludicola]|uniref:Cytochrome ubiquinol oxidase subunit I n=1 Tax=Microbacterium paludicola TaxID=300019 RepID=A0A4Y9FTK2_9MICO|nr:cytochrome ubiquinol oxidase subunit I [Microbacterium paludicola]MBF0816695.1 cytochrome ubiquinol oxidase subunit I [Microbacterium paludicola]TFU32575.1 cytochrome ubiquinol oxidase subunit I [Microbacterium paludicola]
MDPLDIARWQFGITTVYHFLLVPLTLGLGVGVALMQTAWVRTGDERWLRMTKFWGKLYLINFILGVATGLVQEFQFGMAWSEYSRFVGDVFGAPLAMEGLLAFFAESTFLGVWIFGWGRLRKGVHLAALWLAVTGSWFSAYFIIVANSWMQHPVGVELDADGRPVMTDIWAVLGNNTAIAAFAHVIAGALMVGGMFLLGIAWYHLWRRRHDGIDTVGKDGRVVVGSHPDIAGRDEKDHGVWLRSLRIGALVAIVGFGAVAITGDIQGKLMYEQQPMKMAAAEAACHTGSSFSVLSIGDPGAVDCADVQTLIEVPGVLGWLAKGDFGAEMPGIQDLEPQYVENFGAQLPDDPRLGDQAGRDIEYVPLMWVTYWGFRLMIGLGAIPAGAAVVALWLTRKGTVPASKWIMRLALLGILAPFAANIAGWIFTELGRQPFVVAPNPDYWGTGDAVFMFTAAAVSPGTTVGELLFSVISLTAVYGILLVVLIGLMVKYTRGGVAGAMPDMEHGIERTDRGPDEHPDDDRSDDRQPPASDGDKKNDVLSFAY